MSDTTIALLSVVALFTLIVMGMHVAFALGLTSFVGMVLLTDVDVAVSLLSQTAISAVNDLLFALVPLFILMGAFMTNSSMAADLFAFMNFFVSKVRAGLAIATVFANAMFAAVTGISLASAAVFSTVAYPQMVRHGYSRMLALGSVAGSSVLGMLIPPSVLLILYGILTRVSIGDLFLAGIVPGVLLSLVFAIGIFVMVTVRPELADVSRAVAGRRRKGRLSRLFAVRSQPRSGAASSAEPSSGAEAVAPDASSEAVVPDSAGAETVDQAAADSPPPRFGRLLLSSGPVAILFALVMGGIWGGIFTPTEAGAVGAAGALLVAAITGLKWRGLLSSFTDTAIATGSIMILLVMAQLYSRMLSTGGFVDRVGETVTSWDIPAHAVIVVFVILLIMLGTMLDSSSIILITVPLMFPVVTQLGLDPLWFGIVMIVAVEVGIITPPFGMIPFAMSGVLGDKVDVVDIFRGAAPFIVMMFLVLGLLIAFEPLATWLPGLINPD